MPVPRPHARAERQPAPRRTALLLSAGGILIAVLALFLMRSSDRPAPTLAAPDSSAAPAARPVPPARTGEVVFLNRNGGTKASVTVEIADDEHTRALGLMYRRALAQDHGMLFIFDSSAVQSFWMRNTFISLDMIFADAEGTIVTIHRHTTPRSLQSYVSEAPSLYVVEVRAGFSEAHDLRTGDRIQWRRTP